MRRTHVRSLDVESLEARQLLTKAPHHAAIHAAIAHHPAHVAPKFPIALDGTLTVNNKATTASEDVMGDVTSSIPVSGTLGALGPVSGIWQGSVDSMGSYVGPDSLRLKTAQGSVTVAFNDGAPAKLQKTPQGTYFYQLKQMVSSGTGAYAHATESGTIDMGTTKGRVSVLTMTIHTTSS